MASTYVCEPGAEVSTHGAQGAEFRFQFDDKGHCTVDNSEAEMAADTLVTRGVLKIAKEKK